MTIKVTAICGYVNHIHTYVYKCMINVFGENFIGILMNFSKCSGT